MSGASFEIQALTADRYRSVVNGTFDVTGSGGGRYPLTLDVTGTLVDSRAVWRHVPADGRDHEPVRRQRPREDDRIVCRAWIRR